MKRIAALAAGGALLATSLAVADVTYSNTQIVNQNGQPVVKVVVGKTAAASDGVVAANIAAVIGNHAYSKQTLSATLSGTAKCTAGAAGGAGTCPVSDKKVTLEVTLPGVVSGSASFKTYINDYVDKYLEDRQTSPLGISNNYSTTTEIKPVFTGSVSTGHLTTAAPEIADPNAGGTHGRKVTGSDFPPIATASVRDTYAGKTYTEEQTLWVYGTTEYDENLKTVVANTPYVAYKLDFTHDTYGLPISTCANYNSTTCTATDLTQRHRVGIKFLGEDWIISELNSPTITVGALAGNYNTTAYMATVGAGGVNSISLAKESAYGIIHIGENLTAGAYSLKLADIGLATGAANEHAAAIEIYDANGVLVKEDQIFPNQGTYSWTAPDGSKLKVRVYQTQPGYTLASKWAEMAVYSNEITLTHNVKLDNVDNPLWYPYIYWSVNPNNNNVPTLRTIVLRRDPSSSVTLKLQKGDNLGIITTPTKFQLSFDGLNLDSTADYDSMSFTVSQYGLAVSPTNDCNTVTNLPSTQYLLYVVTGLSNGFTVGGQQSNSFYVDLTDVLGYTGAPINQSAYVYYQVSGQTCYYRTTIANQSTIATYNSGDGVMQSLILANAYNNSAANVSVRFTERASTTTADTDSFQLELDNATGTWIFTGSSTQTKIRYFTTGLAKYASTANKMVEPGFTTERGSMFSSLSSTAAVLKIAKKVGEATYYVSSTGAAPSGATTITLAEGEQQTLAGGVVIKAKSITEKVGGCTATGTGGCTVDMSPVSAVLNTGDASKDVITSYKLSGDLVVLDTPTPSASVLISVGGPAVNEVTKAALGGSSTLTKSGDVVVKEVGNTIVVAGYTAQDTIDAGKQFISGLQVS